VGDANAVISDWCRATDWNDYRAVVFLDPYGMSVDWSTIERIAATKAIDLWILFPLGAGLNRMLTRGKKPPASWIARIDRILGTEAWQEIFYKELVEQGLFGEEVTRIVKTATFASMTKFFLERLESVFEGVSPEAMALTNSTGNPLYMLCFAAGSKAGAPIAVRIANHLLKD
jgi:three-Cys-motif partner protein